MKSPISLLAVLWALFGPAYTAVAYGGSQHQSSHVHGTAELLFVMDGGALEIELRTPALNLLGFEGRPVDADQRARMAETRSLLLQPEQMFRVQGPDCRLAERGVEISGLPEENEHGAHDGHEHESGAPESSHHAQVDQHESTHSSGEAHAYQKHTDIVVTYRFNCRGSDAAEAMQLPMLDKFPGIAELHAQWIVAGRQGASRLVEGNNSVSFR